VNDFESASDLAQAIEAGRGDLTARPVELTFRDRRIQQQIFRKVKRRRRWRNHLFLASVAYDERTASCCFDAWVYQYQGDRRPYQRFPQIQCRMPFAVAAGRAEAEAIIRAADLLSLTITVCGRPSGVEKLGRDRCRLVLAGASITARRGKELLCRGDARMIEPGALPGPAAPLRTGMHPLREETSAELEAEDAPALLLYADWERDVGGWYARELTRGCSGKGIAVVHERNMGQAFAWALPAPLPAGHYRVEVEGHYTSARFRANRIRVALADAVTDIAWFYGQRDNWMTGPVFRTSRPADALFVKAVQSGGGGVNCAPELRDMVIMLDRIRVVAVETEWP
jgi:hypothetical protein